MKTYSVDQINRMVDLVPEGTLKGFSWDTVKKLYGVDPGLVVFGIVEKPPGGKAPGWVCYVQVVRDVTPREYNTVTRRYVAKTERHLFFRQDFETARVAMWQAAVDIAFGLQLPLMDMTGRLPS